jgi:hypothetical protein
VAGPLARDLRSELRAAEHVLDSGIGGDVRDSQRQRDLVAPHPTRFALAVPALGEVGEETGHRRRQPQTGAQHLGHLARCGEMRSVLSCGPRESPRDLGGADRERASGLGQRADDSREHLGPGPEHEGNEVRRQPAA